MFVKTVLTTYLSARHKDENTIKTENSKPNIPENNNVTVKTVNTTTVSDNILDIFGITETWLSNDDKNNMPVVNTYLDSGYTLQKHW